MIDYGRTSGPPRTSWHQQTSQGCGRMHVITAPDAGSTLSLMTLTLMALGLVARRFQRAAG